MYNEAYALAAAAARRAFGERADTLTTFVVPTSATETLGAFGTFFLTAVAITLLCMIWMSVGTSTVAAVELAGELFAWRRADDICGVSSSCAVAW
jgi:hypothetical protein